MSLVARKPVFGGLRTTQAQTSLHSRSLISAFIIPFLESIICKLATGEISNFQLASIAEETGLKHALSDTPKTGFLATRSNYCLGHYVLINSISRLFTKVKMILLIRPDFFY